MENTLELTSLPKDLLGLIVQYLEIRDMKRIRLTCKTFCDITKRFTKISICIIKSNLESVLEVIKNCHVDEISFISTFTVQEASIAKGINESHIKNLPRSLNKLLMYFWPNFNDKWIPNLPPALTVLDITGNDVTDEGVKFLPRGLRWLDLQKTKITHKGLIELPVTLTYLSVSNCNLFEAPPLDYLTELKELRFNSNSIEKMLSLPTSLKYLCIEYNGKIPDKEFAKIPRSLTHLSMGFCSMTTAKVIDYLPPSLTSLDMKGSSIKKEELGNLTKLTDLKIIDLTFAKNSLIPWPTELKHITLKL